MTKNKARLLTVLFAVLLVGCVAISMYIKPYGGELSLFHAFAPFCVGIWLADVIDKFYKWLCRKAGK